MHLSATSLTGTDVRNAQGEDLGKIEDLMVDTNTGEVDYAVVSFGGFLGLGDKLFAVPIQAFTVDTDDEELVLNETKERLEKAPGFDKDNWPNHADHTWRKQRTGLLQPLIRTPPPTGVAAGLDAARRPAAVRDTAAGRAPELLFHVHVPRYITGDAHARVPRHQYSRRLNNSSGERFGQSSVLPVSPCCGHRLGARAGVPD